MTDGDFSPIPGFYRFYFKWSDPIVCILAALTDFITPSVTVEAFVPKSVALVNCWLPYMCETRADNSRPLNPYHDFLLQQLGGALLMLAFLSFSLLRVTVDINIWKILEAAVLVYDFSLLYSNYYALSQQGRLSVGALRWEDWGSIAITAQAVVVRTAFLLSVGLGKRKQATKKSWRRATFGGILTMIASSNAPCPRSWTTVSCLKVQSLGTCP